MKIEDPIQPTPIPHRILDACVWLVSIFNPILQVPQVWKVYQTRSAGDFALSTWLMGLFTSLVWLWYGITHKSKPIVFTNICFVTINVLIIAAILLWG